MLCTCMFMHEQTHIHICTCTYIHTYNQTNMHAYIHTTMFYLSLSTSSRVSYFMSLPTCGVSCSTCPYLTSTIHADFWLSWWWWCWCGGLIDFRTHGQGLGRLLDLLVRVSACATLRLALRRVGILTRTVDASLLHPRLGLCFKMYGPRSVHDHLQSGCVRAESTDNKPPSKNHDVASYQQHLFKS